MNFRVTLIVLIVLVVIWLFYVSFLAFQLGSKLRRDVHSHPLISFNQRVEHELKDSLISFGVSAERADLWARMIVEEELESGQHKKFKQDLFEKLHSENYEKLMKFVDNLPSKKVPYLVGEQVVSNSLQWASVKLNEVDSSLRLKLDDVKKIFSLANDEEFLAALVAVVGENENAINFIVEAMKKRIEFFGGSPISAEEVRKRVLARKKVGVVAATKVGVVAATNTAKSQQHVPPEDTRDDGGKVMLGSVKTLPGKLKYLYGNEGSTNAVLLVENFCFDKTGFFYFGKGKAGKVKQVNIKKQKKN